jgi:hypothetical protein
LEDGFPLCHAPLTSPYGILIYAQKIIIEPDWIPAARYRISEFDLAALEYLRQSAKLLEQHCQATIKKSILMPDAWNFLGITAALDNIKSTLETNASLHLQQLDTRVRAAVGSLFGQRIRDQLEKGARKRAYTIIMARVFWLPDEKIDQTEEDVGDKDPKKNENHVAAMDFVESQPDILAFIENSNKILIGCMLRANHLDELQKNGKDWPGVFTDTYVLPESHSYTEMEVDDEGNEHQVEVEVEIVPYEFPDLKTLLKRRPFAFLPFYNFLQKCCYRVDPESQLEHQVFTLLPVNERKRVHIRIDEQYWNHLCQSAQLVPAPMDQVFDLTKRFPKMVLKDPKTQKPTSTTYAGSFTTDGFKISLRFGLKGKEVYTAAAKKEKQRIIDGRIKAKETKTHFAKEKRETRLTSLPPNLVHDGVDLIVGLDPGKRSMITAVAIDSTEKTLDPANHKYKVIKMSGPELYHWEGRIDSRKRDLKYRKKFNVDAQVTALSKLPQPTSSDRWLVFVSERLKLFEAANPYHFHPQRSRHKFQSFSMRQRAFDEVANRLSGRNPTQKPKPNWRDKQHKKRRKQPDQPPLKNIFLGFGDGSIQQGACSGGAMKLPLKTIQRHLASRPNIQFALVKEPFTSKVCSLCPNTHRISPCSVTGINAETGKPEAKEVYGVRACPGCLSGPGTSSSSSNPVKRVCYIDRDVNAARNILSIVLAHGEAKPRPEQFTREFWSPKKHTKSALWPASISLVGSSHRTQNLH